ncbi:fasciclin-like arabinogalactan protein 3 [Panicum hallii]|nr:fasciclin-like arabinogalactan protein 3 [Panicum hallii]
MAPSKLPLLLVTLAVLLPAPPSLGAGFGAGAGTIDITKVLAGFPEFSTFSSMLTETNVALAISSRDKVTVLALNNTAVAVAFGGMLRVPRSLLADLLALHVVLDYIDEPRLGALQHDRKGEGSVVTTLLQVLRAPPRGVGFLRIHSGDDGCAMLSSAAPGGLGRNATVEKQITAKPYSVSVLQVSGFVVPPGIGVPRAFPPRASRHMAAPPRKPPAPAPVPAPGPAPAPFVASGPLVPSPIKPVPTPNLVDTPAPVPEETGVIPIPSVHGGLAAKVPSSAAGRSAANWWSSIAAVALGMTRCLHLHL